MRLGHPFRRKFGATLLLAAARRHGASASLGVLLAFPAGLGPLGIGIGLATGLGVVAASLFWRWHRRDRVLAARPIQPCGRGG